MEQGSIICPGCQGTDVYRVSRHGFIDAAFRYFNRWPWYCRACLSTFHADRRAAPRTLPEPEVSPLEWRRKYTEPTASVVIRAASQPQLEHILLALHEAVKREEERSWRDPVGQ